MRETMKLTKANRLREAREATGLNRTEAAERFRYKYPTLASHESGAREFDVNDAIRYARDFGTSVNHLLALDLIDSNLASNVTTEGNALAVQHIPVHGHAAGGMWLEGDDVPIDNETIAITPHPAYPASKQYARKVVGNSVSNRIRNGEYAVIVRLDGLGRQLNDGDLVDCLRTRAGMYEHSIKELRAGKLMTNSAELQEQSEIPLSAREDDAQVEVLGVVISAVRLNP